MPRLAILGAGPVGLEAAATAKSLKWPFTVYERGRVGEHVLRWGHCKLFTPFGINATLLGRQTLLAVRPAQQLPANDALVTGREYVNAYLVPLAEALQPNLQLETAVLGISRKGLLKEDDPSDRARYPFRLLLRDKKGERVEEADVVLDCTGTYAQHRWLGEGGIPAIGELAAESQISYGLDDVLGDRKNQYANKTTVVVGSGFSAATSVCNLAQLAEEAASTWVVWLARGPGHTPLKRIPGDSLKERDRLVAKANNFATRSEGNVEFHNQTVVENIETLGPDRGFKVLTRCAGKPRAFEVERILANVGYSPDRNLYRELRVHECYASFGPMKLAAALNANPQADCLKESCHGPESLTNPEPNFFILGAKSYGRNSNFLLKVGFEQVHEAFSLIT